MNENAEKLKELFKKKSAEAGKVSELEELRKRVTSQIS